MRKLYFFIISSIMFLSLTQAENAEDYCDLNCRHNAIISLEQNCERTLWPEDVLHYPDPNCTFYITVYNAAGQPIGQTVNSTHVGQTLNVKVSHGGQTCWASIIVGDNYAPIPICDVNTQVTLGSNGVARIYYTTFDDGSYDNCGIQSIQVRRMTMGWCPPGVADDTNYRDYVEFCCEDAQSSPVQVEMKVTDYAGNSNTCWVNVYVADYSHPYIYCPPDITVGCDYPLNYSNLSDFGTVHMNQSDVQPIYINDPVHYPNGHAGYDGYIGSSSGCNGGGNLWVVENYWADVNCGGLGTVYRTFTIEGTNYSCTQKIFIKDAHPFNHYNIHWPKDKQVECGSDSSAYHPDITGRPTYQYDGCSMIMDRYEDEVFTIEPGSCFKILRKWSVLDWCQFEPNGPYPKGRWDHTQVIKIGNSERPTFNDCTDKTFCPTESNGCKGKVELIGQAYDDCTPVDQLDWHYCIDINNDGNGPIQGQYDYAGESVNATGYYPYGTHRILWRVDDNCGNYNTCEFLFTVTDCKKPSPVCLNGISTVVMPSSGMIELNANVFNASSFDNCTPEHKLRYSWSSDPYNTVRLFDCNNIGTNEVRIYVHDEAGNSQYCTTYIILEDNEQNCPFSAMPLISGSARTIGGEPIVNTEVRLDTRGIQISNIDFTDENGDFAFGSFADVGTQQFGLNIIKNDEPMNGVNVLDLLLLQKHIIGMKNLDNFYKEMAADVTDDGNIDVRDLVEIRSLMLGQRTEFSQQTAWIFMEEDLTNSPNANKNDFNIYASTNTPTVFNAVGVKLADLNNSVKLEDVSGGVAKDRTAANFVIQNERLMANKEHVVHVTSEFVQDFSAFNIELRINDAVSIEDVQTATGVSIPYSLENGLLKAVFVDAINKIKSGETAFNIILNADENIEILDVFETSNSLTNEIALYSEEDMQIGWRVNSKEEGVVLNNDFSAYPNPFSQSAIISLPNQISNNSEIQVIDQNGKIIKSQLLEMNQKTAEITANDIPSSGIYWLRLKNNEEIKVIKLLFVK